MSKMQQRLDVINDRLNDLEATVEVLVNDLNIVVARLTAHRADLDSLESKWSDINQELAIVNYRIGQLEDYCCVPTSNTTPSNTATSNT